MPDSELSVADLLELSSLEIEIVRHLINHGPDQLANVVDAVGGSEDEIRKTVAELTTKRYVRIRADGSVDATLGWSRQRTLPNVMWPALLAGERRYSAQEVMVLKTAIPMLQFARARLNEFADHGPQHAMRVRAFATQLGYLLDLSSLEHHLLGAGAWFHDVGNAVDRERHHLISEETVLRLTATGELPFSDQEAVLVGKLCRWHRREYDADQIDTLNGEQVRTGLLASILRVADAMDIDQRRADSSEQHRRVLSFFFPGQLPYWTSLEEIYGLRIRCISAVELEIYVKHDADPDNIQIKMLSKDLAATPLDCTIRIMPIIDSSAKHPSSEATGSGNETAKESRPALLAFPFEPHSLIMAALSVRHLRAIGHSVETLCYPDTPNASAWLWQEILSRLSPSIFSRLIVLGDRPDRTIEQELLQTLKRWRIASVEVSRLNRHPATWSIVPVLQSLGIETVLGGDWAYFWGDPLDKSDLDWAQRAGLCTRDLMLASIRMSRREQNIVTSFLKVVYALARRPIENIAGWSELADSVIKAILADDLPYFINPTMDILAWDNPNIPRKTVGRVIVFEGEPASISQANYWVLEQAIENLGRSSERGIQYEVPYALASWQNENMVELLAINHWREEKATPIRLLYPSDLGSEPIGHEGMVHVRIPGDQASTVIHNLIAACNAGN
jgi:hypothetical protein